MRTNEYTPHPFSYFMGNRDIIDSLELELIALKGKKYICQEWDFTYIEDEIKKVEKTIRYNKILFRP